MTYRWEAGSGWPGRWYLLPLLSISFDDEPWCAWCFSFGWLAWGITLTASHDGDGERNE